YKDALKKHQLPVREELIVNCSNSYTENFVIITDLLITDKPDSVFASVERLAFSIYYVGNHLGMFIHYHLKVMAFCSMQIAELLSPPLSTIVQPAEQIGREAARLLLKNLKNPNPIPSTDQIVLKSELKIRKSSQG